MAATLRDAHAHWIKQGLIDPPIDAGIVLAGAPIWEYQPTAAEYDDVAQGDLIGRGLARQLHANLETLVEPHAPFVIPAITIRQRVPVITTAAPPTRRWDTDAAYTRAAVYYGAHIINPNRPIIITET